MIANLQMYLWQPCLCFYPGLNLQSQFNLDNITVFNKNEQESTLGQKVKILPLDLDSKHFMCCFFKNVIFPTSMFTADRWKGRHHGGGGRWNGGGWRTCALVSGRLALWDCSFSNHLKKTCLVSCNKTKLLLLFSSIPIDYNLYRKFWMLQDYFRNPLQCYDKFSWMTFLKVMHHKSWNIIQVYPLFYIL